ncbi:hypothetical protein CEXT_401461 [Caerostris extrusa]|uniref:Uncharacterized protein n=1 Tax=Caerostris extrusa TaxID=172846 RepID=A0AAV4NIX2_CAEEX|nr:hypothetical protein CEXT_401461 [Caerostris extrusa]
MKNWIYTPKLRCRLNRLTCYKNNTKKKLNEKRGVRGRKRNNFSSKNVKSPFSFFWCYPSSYPLFSQDQTNATFNQCHPGDQGSVVRGSFWKQWTPPLFSRCVLFCLSPLDTDFDISSE